MRKRDWCVIVVFAVVMTCLSVTALKIKKDLIRQEILAEIEREQETVSDAQEILETGTEIVNPEFKINTFSLGKNIKNVDYELSETKDTVDLNLLVEEGGKISKENIDEISKVLKEHYNDEKEINISVVK